MKIGVLMVGSLYWAPARKEWRRTRLVEDAAVRVRAPIRYGRRSSKRGYTYTMVFSAGLDKSRFGQAIVVPCRKRATDVKLLIDEARRLWAAESNSKHLQRISAHWGCVALRPNSRRELPEGILDEWKAYVSRESGYGKLEQAGGEPAVVDSCGILKIPWPRVLDGSELEYDALLGTATDPHICKGRYPTVQRIAEAWITTADDNHVEYFWNNRSNGIRTFQDKEIEKLLDQSRRR